MCLKVKCLFSLFESLTYGEEDSCYPRKKLMLQFLGCEYLSFEFPYITFPITVVFGWLLICRWIIPFQFAGQLFREWSPDFGISVGLEGISGGKLTFSASPISCFHTILSGFSDMLSLQVAIVWIKNITLALEMDSACFRACLLSLSPCCSSKYVMAGYNFIGILTHQSSLFRLFAIWLNPCLVNAPRMFYFSTDLPVLRAPHAHPQPKPPNK